MEFLDDEPFSSRGQEPRSRRPRGSGGGSRPPDRQQQILVRRAIFAGAFVLVVILLVLGVRGCLDARKERAYENYVSDLSSIAAETSNLSDAFFERLQDPGDLTPLQFEAEVKADRGAAEGLLDRAEGLDAPDEVHDAQELIVLSYRLRRDALAAIADRIATALGDRGARRASRQIAGEMRTLLASDVLYEKGLDQLGAVLAEEDLSELEVPASQFLPDEPNWLDTDVVIDALSGVSGATGAASPGVHGLGLGTVTLLPTGAALSDGVAVTAAAEGAELEIEVENQGESEETDVTVNYEFSSNGDTSRGEEQISRIDVGDVETVNIPIQPAPAGATGELTVTAEPVPGEEIEDNNTLTAEVTFE